MKIGVTSVTGQLGNSIVRQLLKTVDPKSIIGFARTPSKAQDLGFEVFPGDYNNKQHFLANLSGVDALLLVSGMDAPGKKS
ncbi:MAG: hypothetical protein K9J12_13695 [Melioribacteraceae bacterium]|nr:hypothetical protein [Melioribacteraceae bacterium]MCF8263183.1 hypothetical protein [Melioribacteraceae bacterium]MCF8430329.1 hypothetical protein [Melioribacteraceae bacterium]